MPCAPWARCNQPQPSKRRVPGFLPLIRLSTLEAAGTRVCAGRHRASALRLSFYRRIDAAQMYDS